MLSKDQLKNLAYTILILRQSIGLRRLTNYAKNGIGFTVVQLNKLPTNQNILVLAPHPDDEVFGCGGTLKLLADRSNKITVLYLTDGSHGTQDGRQDLNLGEQRKNEAAQGMKLLGGTERIHWDAPDGGLRPTAERLASLVDIILEFEPAIIFTPWESDQHPDHQMTFLLLVQTLQKLQKIAKLNSKMIIWQYEVWSPLLPNRLVPIQSVLGAKTKAIKAHASQLESVDYLQAILGLNTYRGITGMLKEPAEAFFALPVQQLLDFVRHLI